MPPSLDRLLTKAQRIPSTLVKVVYTALDSNLAFSFFGRGGPMSIYHIFAGNRNPDGAFLGVLLIQAYAPFK